MMLFWILSAIGLAIATLLTCLPLFRQKTGWTPIALALVFALPVGALLLYQEVGTPEAIGLSGVPQASTHAGAAAAAGEIDDLVGKLRARLDESPESLEGWVLLARTLKTMQRYPEALEALQTAKRIAPDDPFVTVELVEAQLFMSQGGMISEDMIKQLQAALDQDPGQQKALWLLGVAAAQSGDDEAAISYWETLLEQVEADSPIRSSVQEQISAAQLRLGIDAPESVPVTMAEQTPPHPAPSMAAVVPTSEPAAGEASEPAAGEVTPVDSANWAGIDVQVTGGAALPAGVPENAVLFVMIRTPGVAAGPPIGVRRVIGPTLPLSMTVSDQDSMLQERLISSEPQVQLQARLSLSGSPGARSGDWQSLPVTVPLDSTKSVELVLDQQVE
jgi:cytochrome c-type biogenesis protein CcmH